VRFFRIGFVPNRTKPRWRRPKDFEGVAGHHATASFLYSTNFTVQPYLLAHSHTANAKKTAVLPLENTESFDIVPQFAVRWHMV